MLEECWGEVRRKKDLVEGFYGPVTDVEKGKVLRMRAGVGIVSVDGREQARNVVKYLKNIGSGEDEKEAREMGKRRGMR